MARQTMSEEERLDAATLRARFDSAPRFSIGIEDELMLLDPDTLELAPHAAELLGRLEGDQRFKLELPAAQLEIVTPACATVAEAIAALLAGRRDLSRAAAGSWALAAAGVHPFSSGIGVLNTGGRYDEVAEEYGSVARRQLVCALQVHVAVGDSERALDIYNSARTYLPLIAALAANAPFYEGVDTGLASVRPKIATLLPRQGLPPVIEGWDGFASVLDWGSRTGRFANPATWWWELRPHPSYGTLEFRVPDGQATVAEAAAIAALVQALVAWLDARLQAGETVSVHPSWMIDENRWLACRDGVEGEMVDLESGARAPTRAILSALLDSVEPFATELGAAEHLAAARQMVSVNGAIAQRRVAAGTGPQAVAAWLSERFLLHAPG